MNNKFEHKNIEQKMYKNWEEKGYFKSVIDESKKPFVIVMPPPNVTGKLHMGHALDDVIQDILIRYNKMKGIPTLWVPGTDHASIATEVKVIEKLKKEGKSKDLLGREEFLKEAWAWKDEYGGHIKDQVRKLGASCDWDKERFTMDETCTKAVLEAFNRLYEKGYIYKGQRIVNWCPCCKTSISETEVEYKENKGDLWHIKYNIEDSDEYLVVATTRPETMLGDSALAVYPSDERYKHLQGKKAILPLIGRKIDIIADEYVEKEFGTGVVKITPAHDLNDFMVGNRHNLERINIMNEDATINELGGKYAKMDRYEARKAIVEDLDKEGYLVKVEDYDNNVGTCYRCHTTIEPYLSLQWFVKMKQLVKPALEAVRNEEIKFIPKRFEKQYFNWMENIEDWCISRQLWWGHRIPAYYCDKCSEITVSRETVNKCKCGGNLFQDEDTLDTWFSSALWPFSVFGWPDNNKELNYYYPTSTLVTGYDIITFWVSKMIFSGLEYMNEKPFKNIYIHGIVRDELGRKMSKSLGNGIDPLQLIDEYGTDSLRMSLIQNTSAGNDIKYSKDRIESAYIFTNKLWNSAKFVNMYINDEIKEKVKELNKENKIEELINSGKLNIRPEDKWILNKLNKTINNVKNNLESFELGVAFGEIYSFIIEDFCDWYIEMVKPRLYNKEDDSYFTAVYILNYVLKDIVKLLHPYMPFITEEIYLNLVHSNESIMISNYPKEIDNNVINNNISVVEDVINYIKVVRNIRSTSNIPNSKKLDIYVIDKNNVKEEIKLLESIIIKLIGIEKINYVENIENENKYNYTNLENIDIYLDLSNAIDKQEEISKIKNELETAKKELKRAEGMLSNDKFVSKAPEKLINLEKEKIVKYTEIITNLEERLKKL